MRIKNYEIVFFNIWDEDSYYNFILFATSLKKYEVCFTIEIDFFNFGVVFRKYYEQFVE